MNGLSGKELSITWSRLAETANTGDTVIVLQDQVENIWNVGDQIVIATTGHRHTQVQPAINFNHHIPYLFQLWIRSNYGTPYFWCNICSYIYSQNTKSLKSL